MYCRRRYGVGQRMSLKHTRAIVDAIHSGELAAGEFSTTPIFGLQTPVACAGGARVHTTAWALLFRIS